MLSSTVRSGSSRRPSGTIAIPAARIRSGRRPAKSWPSSMTEPARSPSTPPTASTRLDFPAPFGPSSAETSLTTVRRPRSTVRPCKASRLFSTLASGAPPTSPSPFTGACFPRRSVAGSLAPRSSRRRAPLARSLDLRRAQVGADHPLVPQHLGGRPGRDQLAEVEHGGGLAAGGHQAHVVVDEDRQRSGVLGDPADDLAQVPGLLVGQ